MRTAIRVALLAVALVLTGTRPMWAEARHAAVVFGAAGGDSYREQFAKWQEALETALEQRLGFEAAHIHLLSGVTDDPAAASTAINVRRLFDTLRTEVKGDDLVLILLVGHGSAEGPAAKFNLVGPDLDASEWAALVNRLPARVVFINSTGASFPFLEQLSDRNRIVITATDSAAQRFDTAFPDLLIQALEDPATDRDRNGRLSVWEVFTQVSEAVGRYYEQRGQLTTERPLLDDNGDRVGQEASAPGPDGALARTTYLDADPVASISDPEIAALAARQRVLEEQAEALKLKKSSMPAAQWEAEFEKLMIELARVSHAIRQRS